MGFKILAESNVTNKNIAAYPITELDDDTVFYLRCASAGNEKYRDEMFKLTGLDDDAPRRKKVKIDSDFLNEQREADRVLFPLYIVTGWENVLDDKTGKEIPYSVEKAKELFADFPEWLFDPMRVFVNQPENFTKTINSEAKGKN